MTGRTITGSYSTGVTLTNTADSPLIIEAGASIANVSGAALRSALAFYWAIDNSGTLQSTASPSGVGIALAAGAAVTNEQVGRIAGYSVGVSIAGTGTVVNQGSISNSQTMGGSGHSYDYNPTTQSFIPLSGGVIMGGGGVSNAASATISSYVEGVALGGGGGVVNAGSIGASSTASGFGVVLPAGGSVSNAATGTITAGRYAVLTFGTVAATVTNQGFVAGRSAAVMALGSASATVTNAGTLVGTSFAGVYLSSGGFVTNAGSGLIASSDYGVRALGTGSTVVNLGSISSSKTFGGAGVDLVTGGTVSNGLSGNISAKWIGVQIGATTANAAGTVLNQGTIFASDGTNGAAVWIHGPALIDNAATGTIAGGPFAVVLYNQATVINRGSIGGTEFAIYQAKIGYAVHVTDFPGAVFSGVVEGSNKTGAAAGILELASGTSIGSITGFGNSSITQSNYIGFSQVTIDAGADWSFGGTVTATQTVAFGGSYASLALANPRSMAGRFTGFNPSDTIFLAGVTDVTAVSRGALNVLTVSESSGSSFNLQFDPAMDYSNKPFGFVTVGGGTRLTVACFAAGTRILAEQGPVPVQALRPGMRVRALFGGSAEIQWTGHRSVDCRRHKRPEQVWPVCIRGGAFGPGQPTDDVYLSPDHAVYVNAVLIPIRYLINGSTVRQVAVDEVAYFHVELARHDVLLAQGLPVESYLDTGDRGNFANGGATARLWPDFRAPARDASAVWDAKGCARLVIAGPELEAARSLVNDRAAGARRRDQACDGAGTGLDCDPVGRKSQIAA